MKTAKKLLPYIVIIILLIILKNNLSFIINYNKSGSALNKLNEKLAAEQKKNKYFKEKLEIVKTDKFVADQAQNKLGMLKEGEYFVIAPTAAPDTAPIQTLNTKPNWKKWIDLFF